MEKNVIWRFLFLTLILNYEMLFVNCLPCKSVPNCDCDENETVVKCRNMVGLSSLSGLQPDVVSLTVSNSFLGPTLNVSFSTFIMEVEELDLSNSHIHSITNYVFKYLRHLKRLNLQRNFLRILNFEVFAHLNSLEELDLSHNRFGSLPDRPFYSLTSLQKLNISFNELTDLKLGLRFQVMEHMRMLDFSGNKFHMISADTFQRSEGWYEHEPKIMNLSYCGIKYIEVGAFRNPKGLHSLILKGNMGISLSNLTYLFNSSDSPNIKNINLSNTSLTDVSELFSSLRRRNIEEMDLSHNNITVLSLELSENLAGTLDKLDVSHNMLTSLSTAVTELSNLKFLDLSHNDISDIDSNFDTSLPELKELSLAHNQITSGSFTLQEFVNLENLDLSYNQLSTFIIPDKLIKLHSVNLAGNAITNLNTLDGLVMLENFDFKQNKLTKLNKFLFVDSPSIKAVNFSGNDIQEIEDFAFDPHSPQYIDLSYNQLTKLKFPGWENVKTLNLKGNSLESIDGEAFYSLFQLTSLDLSKNKLVMIEGNTFLYLTNLTSLNLRMNQLIGVPNWGYLFKSLSLLEFLDLSYNNLTKFESSHFSTCKSLESLNAVHNRIFYVEISSLKEMNKLKRVDFSGNRFLCNCDMIEFRDWIRDSGIEIAYEEKGNYSCYGPHHQKGKSVDEFEVDEFECDFIFLYIVVYSTVGGIFVVVVVMVAFVCHYHLKWRRTLLQSEIAPSIEFESMEHSPFIPDTIQRGDKHKNKRRHLIPIIRTDKEYLKLKKRKSKNVEKYLMDANMKVKQNGKLSNGKLGIKSTNKSHSKNRPRKKRRNSDSTHMLRHVNELIIPKPRRKTTSNLELNPYVQQYLWQQHRKQQKNIINKKLNRESFRNVDVIRPIHGSRSNPDFNYTESSTLPRSYKLVDQRYGENLTGTRTWQGSHSKQHRHNSYVDLQQMDNIDNRHNFAKSGYNTIGGVPSHRPHAHYI